MGSNSLDKKRKKINKWNLVGSSDTLSDFRCFHLQPCISRVPVREKLSSSLSQLFGRCKKRRDLCATELLTERRLDPTSEPYSTKLLKTGFVFSVSHRGIDLTFYSLVNEPLPVFVHIDAEKWKNMGKRVGILCSHSTYQA